MKHMAKKIIHTILFLLVAATCRAQQDSTAFLAYLINNEYQVYMRINLYNQDIEVPGQELYGQLPGYLGKQHNSFCWVVTTCRLLSDTKAELQLINDYGSEDLRATLISQNDTTYTLRQESGSPLKVPHQGKWRKLPKLLELKKTKETK